MMRPPPGLALCSLILSAACAEGPDGPVLFDRGSEDRRVLAPEYDTIWHYGGIHDTLFGAPTRLAATPDNALYVLDPMLQQVARFSAQGAVEWSWGSKGEGPGEIANVRALDVAADGGVLLADSGNCRLVFLSPSGLLEREQTVVCDDFSLIEGVALLSSGNVILDTNRMALPWILVSPDGGQVDMTPPWSGFETLHFLQRYGNTAASDDDVWVFGFETGNGWFAMQHQQVLGTYPYVEHTDFPDIIVTRSETTTMWRMATRPAYSAFSMDVWRDTMYVIPGGHTRHRMRVVDKYDVTNGRYLYSQGLPDVVANLAVTGDRIFVLDDRELYPQITSLVWKGNE